MFKYYIIYTAIVAASFTTSLLSLLQISKIRNSKLLAPDAHKPYHVLVPKIGGLSVVIAAVVSLILLKIFEVSNVDIYILLASVITMGLIGLVDDIVGLRPAVRILSSAALAIIVVIFGELSHEIYPLGLIHSTVIVTILAILSIVILTNAVNMLDIMNGIVSGSSLMMTVTLCIICALEHKTAASLAYMIMAAACVPLYLYNKYPARVFNGNVGSYALGAFFGVAAACFGTYLETVLSGLPYILNGMFILFSTRGRVFFGGRERAKRPIFCISGRLVPNLDADAPLTLARLAVLAGCRDEKCVVNSVLKMFILCGTLTVITFLIMKAAGLIP